MVDVEKVGTASVGLSHHIQSKGQMLWLCTDLGTLAKDGRA